MAGMSGKKADKTVVKSAAQFVVGRLTGRRDVDGMAQFARDLYDLTSVELRADAIAQAAVESLCGRINEAVEDIAGSAPYAVLPTKNNTPFRCDGGVGVDANANADDNDNGFDDILAGCSAKLVSSTVDGFGGVGDVGGVKPRFGLDPDYVFIPSLKRFAKRTELALR